MSGVLVADCLEPFDYTHLPPDVVAIAGYCGESTDHVWSAEQRAAVTATGRRWWAIWTPRSQSLTSADGQDAAVGMSNYLHHANYPPDWPVFLDVERHVWDTNQAGARGAVSTWQAFMTNRGWPHAYPYAPIGSGVNWLPEWTNTRPPSVPTGSIGVQFTGNAHGGEYDLSLFSQALWDAGSNPAPEVPAMFDADEIKYLDAMKASINGNIDSVWHALFNGQAPGGPYLYNVAAIQHKVDAVQETLDKTITGGIDPATLAAQLAPALMAQLGPEVVKALAAQLAK